VTVRGEKLRGRSRRPNIRGENAHHGSERARHHDLLARWNVRIRLFELHSRNRGYQHENARNCRARETGFSVLPRQRRLSDGERVWLTLKLERRRQDDGVRGQAAISGATRHRHRADHQPRQYRPAPAGQVAYVTVGGLNQVKAIRTADFEQFATIPVGDLPHGIWPSGDGARVYVGIENGDAVTAIDTSLDEPCDRHDSPRTGGAGAGLCPAGCADGEGWNRKFGAAWPRQRGGAFGAGRAGHGSNHDRIVVRSRAHASAASARGRSRTGETLHARAGVEAGRHRGD